ncbi:hypothetical protein ALNOE001_15590 [Candidatus Methanobinarius endosymbioticus]|uniref:Carboxypeptidase regulatory-like domain-containing protein n=1 Tax=Candidatus Methanobinarius endosymbioticus TaxID=2006182 RepID=A0A366M901_9EURY|nr:hypothetical protein ALNOE001_15590 [Candidatus Methanobinarius endosymbioticus]
MVKFNISYLVNTTRFSQYNSSILGNDEFLGSSTNSSFIGLNLNISVVLGPVGDVKFNSSVFVSGYLLDEFGNPIVGANVRVVINGFSYVVVTDSSGRFRSSLYT